MRAEELQGEIQYDWRDWRGASEPHMTLCLALSGQPGGIAKIQELNKKRMQQTKVPPELMTRDSTAWAIAQMWGERQVKEDAAVSERLGLPGTPLFADYWINRGPTRDSQTVAVNDGKIRIIELGGLGCEGCVLAMFMLERLGKKFPGLESVTIQMSGTTRGNRVVGAKVVADDIANHILSKMHLTYPYGIKMPNGTQPTEDDGEIATYNTEIFGVGEYPMLGGKPTLYIVDGHGVIRFVCVGAGLERERQFERVLEFLQKESGVKS
jgi:hypothetical protein